MLGAARTGWQAAWGMGVVKACLLASLPALGQNICTRVLQLMMGIFKFKSDCYVKIDNDFDNKINKILFYDE